MRSLIVTVFVIWVVAVVHDGYCLLEPGQFCVALLNLRRVVEPVCMAKVHYGFLHFTLLIVIYSLMVLDATCMVYQTTSSTNKL